MCTRRSLRAGYQAIEHGNAIEIRNGTIFVFYPGLPHMIMESSPKVVCKGNVQGVCQLVLLS